jgi:peroxiredoxin
MPEKLKPGQKAPDFTLPGVSGAGVSLSQRLPAADSTVILFICNHCPYVQAYIPRLIALQQELGTRGKSGKPMTQLIAIGSNDDATYPDDSFDNMKRYAAKWGLNFPYLRDRDQAVARAYGAERTPEIFLLDEKGVCRYEGGIDDNYQDASRVTRRPLRDAIAAVSRGEAIAEPRTHAIGCTIKWIQA